MMRRSAALLIAIVIVAPPASAQTSAAAPANNIVAGVRALIAKDDFSAAEKSVRAFIADKGKTPEALEALSWLGRGALARKRLDEANRFATETYGLSLEALKGRTMDAEPRLPIAIGAAMEVQAHVMAQQGNRSEAVYFLQRELDEYKNTSLRARIQKNIHLLSLEGRPAPAYGVTEYVGDVKPPTLASLRGKPVMLFLWAHWCGDCKSMSGALAELRSAYKDKGFTIVAPTQRYGYVAKRAPADARSELAYIGQIAKEFYGNVDWTVPVDNESFAAYGTSTTPTIVLIDREGTVRLYHPGQMTKEQLEPHIKALVEGRPTN
jgi:cytochrome c biogenesis protein CcmG/thiol:disulfide interchange protein DsbE